MHLLAQHTAVFRHLFQRPVHRPFPIPQGLVRRGRIVAAQRRDHLVQLPENGALAILAKALQRQCPVHAQIERNRDAVLPGPCLPLECRIPLRQEGRRQAALARKHVVAVLRALVGNVQQFHPVLLQL